MYVPSKILICHITNWCRVRQNDNSGIEEKWIESDCKTVWGEQMRCL